MAKACMLRLLKGALWGLTANALSSKLILLVHIRTRFGHRPEYGHVGEDFIKGR